MSFNPPNVSLHCYTTCLFSVLFHGKTTEDSDVKEVDVLVDPCVSLYYCELLLFATFEQPCHVRGCPVKYNESRRPIHTHYGQTPSTRCWNIIEWI